MSELGSLLNSLSLASSLGAVVVSLIYHFSPRQEFYIVLRRLSHLHFWLLCGAVVILLSLLLRPDFSNVYVAENVNTTLPLFYRFTALWAGQAGSMLWWNFLLAFFSILALIQIEKKEARLIPYMTMILMGTSFFFSALTNFSETSDPFRQISQNGLPYNPGNGRGLNPLLQHWAMVIHPPILYFGYVSFAIPYAIAMATLMVGRTDIPWTKLVRRYSLFSWFFLGTGMLLGGKWAYEELGWGGYWAWDPVENASLMPWLSATAFVHSIIVQERRGMLKVWNMVLISLSFILTIFGTFLTRSGVVSSVHSFANSDLGPFFLSYIAFAVLFSSILIIKNLHLLRSERTFESWLSREVGFLFNNMVLMIALFAVFWGTLYPTLSEAFSGKRVSVTAQWFNDWMVPLGLIVLFLTGAGPLLSWRSTSAKTLRKNFRIPLLVFLIILVLFWSYWAFEGKDIELKHVYASLSFSLAGFVAAGIFEEWIRASLNRSQYTGEPLPFAFISLLFQNKRRYLGYMTHLALAILYVGFAGQAFGKEKRLELYPGEAEYFAGYLIWLEEVQNINVGQAGGIHYATQLARLSFYHKNHLVGQDTTEIRRYPMLSLATFRYSDPPQTTSEPAIISRPHEDIYAQLGGQAENGRYILQLWINPLVFWVWFGFGFFVLSTLLLLLPVGEKGEVSLWGRKMVLRALPRSI
ncbi:MAG: cytochrome c biogenesis protein CcsA [Leptospiraceae bacterium]|nr:cytochrome c biogenesis protein CcsA [Leptospiraceae bacterium]MDW8306509.1 cytochrome c-type biogenesis CcmF C-terminal domain-containing protein [Leptospiraceae bacterium]